MFDYVVPAVSVWLALQLPLGLVVGAAIRAGREREAMPADADRRWREAA